MKQVIPKAIPRLWGIHGLIQKTIIPVLATLTIGLGACKAEPRLRKASCNGVYRSGTSIQLAKGWKYYIVKGKQKRPAFLNPDFDDSRWKTLRKFPFSFQDLRVPNYRVGATVWLRCHLELDGRPPDGMALSIGVIEDSDEAWLNGEAIGKTGSPDEDKSDIEKFRLYSVPGHLWREGRNTIVLRIRGLSLRANMKKPPSLIQEKPWQRFLLLRDVPQIVFSNIYILVSAFFGLFFVFFWRQKENLFFALFCLSLGLYNLIRTYYRYDFFESFEDSFQTELLLLFSLPLLFSEYYHHLIEIRRSLLFKVLYGLYAFLILITLLRGEEPRNWYYLININLALLLAATIGIIHSFRKEYEKHKQKLRYILYGFAFLLPTVFWDVLATLGLHSLPRLTVYGFFFFLAAISMQLSNSILDLYKQIEVQERELRLLEKKRTRSLFNLSNEFNNIIDELKAGLPSLASSRKAAKKKTVSKFSKKDLGRLEHSVLNLENLVRDSSLLVLLENKEYNPRKVSVNLQKLCKDTIAKALLATEQSSRRVRFEWNAEIKEIQGDPDLISTAIYHLLENALLYSLGSVELQAVYEGEGHILFSVRDEGPGIPQEKLELVVQKFTRANDETPVPGSGIGLTIVNHIMDYLEGKLEIDSGQGFYFEARLRFPVEVIS